LHIAGSVDVLKTKVHVVKCIGGRLVTECWRVGDPGTWELLDWRHAEGEELLRANAVVYRRRFRDALHLPETRLHLPARGTGKV